MRSIELHRSCKLYVQHDATCTCPTDAITRVHQNRVPSVLFTSLQGHPDPIARQGLYLQRAVLLMVQVG